MTGEEWIVEKTGAYLPGAYEEVVDIVDAYVLTEKVFNKSFYFANINILSYFLRTHCNNMIILGECVKFNFSMIR